MPPGGSLAMDAEIANSFIYWKEIKYEDVATDYFPLAKLTDRVHVFIH